METTTGWCAGCQKLMLGVPYGCAPECVECKAQRDVREFIEAVEALLLLTITEKARQNPLNVN